MDSGSSCPHRCTPKPAQTGTRHPSVEIDKSRAWINLVFRVEDWGLSPPSKVLAKREFSPISLPNFGGLMIPGVLLFNRGGFLPKRPLSLPNPEVSFY